jgi:hypothetical protein
MITLVGSSRASAALIDFKPDPYEYGAWGEKTYRNNAHPLRLTTSTGGTVIYHDSVDGVGVMKTRVSYETEKIDDSKWLRIIFDNGGAPVDFIADAPAEVDVKFTATPKPGAVWVLGSALIGLAVVARRRNRR